MNKIFEVNIQFKKLVQNIQSDLDKTPCGEEGI